MRWSREKVFIEGMGIVAVVAYSSKNCGGRRRKRLMVLLSIAAGTAVAERPNEEKGFV